MKDRLFMAMRLIQEAQEIIEICENELDEDGFGKDTELNTPESIEFAQLAEANLHILKSMPSLASAYGLMTGELDYQKEYENLQKLFDEEDEKYYKQMTPAKPIVYLNELSLPTRKMIKDLAQIEFEELRILKHSHAAGSMQEPDIATFKRSAEINKKGEILRMKLLGSDLAIKLLDIQDPFEQNKTFAGILLCLYSQEKTQAIIEDRKADDSLYFAGENIYRHAIMWQKMSEDLGV